MTCIITLRMTQDEKERIDAKADACCLSRSAYIRQTALGIVPRSKLDHQAIHALAKLNGDIGRLGGLLKLWLSRDEYALMHHNLNIRELVAEISTLKNAIHTLVDSL